MRIGDLPPEIHDYIAIYVSLAGTSSQSPHPCETADLHYTSPSILALESTSRYWSSICKPYKFNFLPIVLVPAKGNGENTVLFDLVERLKNLAPHERRVRHLQLREPVVFTNEVSTLDFTSTIPRLLDLLAPTLHSLVLSFPYSRYSTSLFAFTYSVPFPQLRHLSINGFYPPPRLPPSITTTADNEGQMVLGQPNFPVLRTLRLQGVRNPTGLLCSHRFQLIFPVLRKLVIGGLADASGFANEVAHVLSTHDDFTSRIGDLSHLLSYEDVYSLLSRENPNLGIPVTLSEFVVNVRQNTPKSHVVPLKRPSKYHASRHEKMLDTFRSLEHRLGKGNALNRVELKVINGKFGA